MKRTLLLCLLLAGAPLAGLAQEKPGAPLAGKLLITGSSTMAPLIEDLAKLFCAHHPGVTISVESGGSARGVADARDGRADIGMASRELKADEQALFALAIARDGVAFVAHKSNPVRGITRMQAREVFAGQVANWKAIGGTDGRIEVVTRTPAHSSLELVSHYLGITPEAIKAAHVVGDNAEVLRLLAANRNAIAFLSIGAAEDAAQKGQPLNILAIDGVMPGSAAVRDGSWPIARPLNLLTRRVPSGVARAFIEFALSPAARATIIARDFVPYLN